MATERSTGVLLVARLQARLNRVFQEVAASASGLDAPDWQPAIDIFESAKSVVLLVEVPGLTASDLHIEASGTVVTIRGAKAGGTPNSPGGRFLCVETGRGRFHREVQLLHPVNTHRGRAHLRDGLLTVEFPRIQDLRQQPHAVAIDDHEQEAQP